MMIYYRMFCHFVQRILGKIQELSSLPFQGGKGDSMRRAAADIVHMMEELLYFCLSGCVKKKENIPKRLFDEEMMTNHQI